MKISKEFTVFRRIPANNGRRTASIPASSRFTKNGGIPRRVTALR
jgi:hypothetical protein